MSDDRERTDEELARAAQGGDAEAYDRLVRRYLRPAMALAWQYMRSVEDAEDMVQEGFHRAVRALDRYDSRRSFSAWFYAIVRNVGRTRLRKAGRRGELAPVTPLDEASPRAPTNDPALAGDLRKALAELPPMQEACIRLCDVEGYTSVEAAEMLGIVEGTVRTHVHRARKQLRSRLDPEVEKPS